MLYLYYTDLNFHVILELYYMNENTLHRFT